MSLPLVPLAVPTPKLRPIVKVVETAVLVELLVLMMPAAPGKLKPVPSVRLGTRAPSRVDPIRPPATKALSERACQRGRICGGFGGAFAGFAVRICSGGVPASFGNMPKNREST